MSEKSEEPQVEGVIRNRGVVDLSWATSPEDLAEIKGIRNVGVVRVRDSLYKHVVSIPMQNVGMVQRVGDDPGPIQELTGQTTLTGAYLAAGDPDTTLMVTGMLVIKPPLESIGFKAICLIGMLIVPEGSEGVISPKMGSLTGKIIYLPVDAAAPRVFNGKESIGAEFLELLPEASPWIVNGAITIEEGVSAELLRAHVSMIILNGKIVAPQALLPSLNALAVEKNGQILAAEEGGAEESPWREKD